MNKIPDDMDLWATSHPMAFEISACLKPMINAKTLLKVEDLQERMQERGAYMLRVEMHDQDKNLWKLVFYLDSRFYCELDVVSPGGIPDIVMEIFQKEKARKDAEVAFTDPLIDRESRTKIIEARTDSLLREGEKTDEQSEDEAEEERLAQEEREAKDANFHLRGVRGRIVNYRLYVAQSK
jgi:hypothetical protein